MKLLHILNPRSFYIPDFQDFLLKALSTDPFVFALDAFIGLSKRIAAFDPNIGLFITVNEANEYVGMALVGNSTTPLAPGCTVLHFYNQGASRESRNLLIQATIEFAKAHGHSVIRAVDTNQRPRAFVKLFEVEGLIAEPIGQVFNFDIEDEPDLSEGN